MEWLKKLLEKHGVPEDIQDEIMNGAKEQEKNFIPKSRFDEVNNSLKELKSQLTDRDTQLKDLSAKVKDNDELSSKIKELQDLNSKTASDYEAKIKNMAIDSALTSALKDSKAKHADLLISKFDREKLKIKEDGSIEGITEQLTSLKEGYKDLFEVALSGSTPNNSGSATGGGSPLQVEYDAAIKAGNMPLAISLKNKMYEPQPTQ